MATSGSIDWKLNRDQVITGALRKLAVLPSGGTPTAEQISDAAQALNALVKAFHADGMPLWALSTHTFTVVDGQATYLVGETTDHPTVMPLKITQAYRTVGGNNVPLIVENRHDFTDLPQASVGTPLILYYQPLRNYGTLKLWPTPDNDTTTITISYQRPFQDMDSGADDFDFPTYWTQALIYNLAWALAPEYGIPPTDRSLLEKDAKYWKSEALSYGSEETSIYFQPDMRR